MAQRDRSIESIASAVSQCLKRFTRLEGEELLHLLGLDDGMEDLLDAALARLEEEKAIVNFEGAWELPPHLTRISASFARGITRLLRRIGPAREEELKGLLGAWGELEGAFDEGLNYLLVLGRVERRGRKIHLLEKREEKKEPSRRRERTAKGKKEKKGKAPWKKRESFEKAEEATQVSYDRVGVLQAHPKGYGFVITDEDDGADVFIPDDAMGFAIHQDKVRVHVFEESLEGRMGRIVDVLSHGKMEVVGTFEGRKGRGFVHPDEERYPDPILIEKGAALGAKTGQKVVVGITAWPERKQGVRGKILEVLGDPKDPGVDIISVARDMGLSTTYPERVVEEAKAMPEKVSKKDIKNRRDLRRWSTFTIDGEHAKDFDDAVSMKRLANGHYLLGVHIADVSHYVKEDSALDEEAYHRGNSVYLLDRVLPMLPEELSNGLCSLREGEDRLTLSLIMELDETGELMKHRIEETVIRSKRRLIYGHVSDFLEGKNTHPSIEGLEEDLRLMEELAKILRKRREERGALDFDFPEREVRLSDEGFPEAVYVADRRIANRIIEEFMLLANETVAEDYAKKKVPFLYRIHETPERGKLQSLNMMMRPFGHKLRNVEDVRPKDVRGLLETVAGTKESTLIEMLILRSLKKARYATEMEGHFGLASDYYTHFTSPIRRYADLIVHRLIKAHLHREKKVLKRTESHLEAIAKQVSSTEKLAQDAERAVVDMKLAQFMEDKVGQDFKGFISAITGFGLFVQLENTVEGLVSYASMSDYFTFDEDNYVAVGRNSRKVYHLGEKVRVRVSQVDARRAQIDFVLREEAGHGKRTRKTRRRQSRYK